MDSKTVAQKAEFLDKILINVSDNEGELSKSLFLIQGIWLCISDLDKNVCNKTSY